MGRKHRNDYNHGKSGWVGGNPRYNRNKKQQSRKNKTMKGLGR